MKKLIYCTFLLLIATACGSSNPAAPTASGPPNVVGNYSGTATFTYITLGRVLSCPATTSVNQNGNSVSIAPIVLSGTCATLGSIPFGSATIDNTGSLGNSGNIVVALPPCGNYNAVASGGFFGNTLQFSLNYTAQTTACVSTLGNFSITGNLSR